MKKKKFVISVLFAANFDILMYFITLEPLAQMGFIFLNLLVLCLLFLINSVSFMFSAN